MIPSTSLSTVLLLIVVLYPRALTTHKFNNSDISGDFIAAFILSAANFVPLSSDLDNTSRNISANVIFRFYIKLYNIAAILRIEDRRFINEASDFAICIL